MAGDKIESGGGHRPACRHGLLAQLKSRNKRECGKWHDLFDQLRSLRSELDAAKANHFALQVRVCLCACVHVCTCRWHLFFLSLSLSRALCVCVCVCVCMCVCVYVVCVCVCVFYFCAECNCFVRAWNRVLHVRVKQTKVQCETVPPASPTDIVQNAA